MRLSYNLNYFGTVIAIVLLALGFRSYFLDSDKWFPPHYFEFNMYVKSIVSLDGTYREPNYFVSVDGGSRIEIDVDEVQELLIGTLIQGDRWRPSQPIIEGFFCDNKSLYMQPPYTASNLLIEIAYIENETLLRQELFDVECN